MQHSSTGEGWLQSTTHPPEPNTLFFVPLKSVKWFYWVQWNDYILSFLHITWQQTLVSSLSVQKAFHPLSVELYFYRSFHQEISKCFAKEAGIKVPSLYLEKLEALEGEVPWWGQPAGWLHGQAQSQARALYVLPPIQQGLFWKQRWKALKCWKIEHGLFTSHIRPDLLAFEVNGSLVIQQNSTRICYYSGTICFNFSQAP